MQPGLILHAQSILGTGHAHRCARLAEAALPHFTVTVLGDEAPPRPIDPAIDWVALPPMRAWHGDFSDLRDDTGNRLGPEFWTQRLNRIRDKLAGKRIDIFCTDLFPFGRRAFARELLPLFDEWATRWPRPLIVCSLREFLVAPRDAERIQQSMRIFRQYYDVALVHGDPALARIEESIPQLVELADRVHYTGYVTPEPPSQQTVEGRADIIVSAGGGAVGFALMQGAVQARRQGVGRELSWLLLPGKRLASAQRAELEDMAGGLDGVQITTDREDFLALLGQSRLSISQAGYNTMMDILITRANALVLPYVGADGGETEQMARAQAFARHGLVRLVTDPLCLADPIAAALAGTNAPSEAIQLRVGGAQATAEALLARLSKARTR